jgi:hypothetical protein
MSRSLSKNNSTTTILGSSGVFTGIAENVIGYDQITININSDRYSATNGIVIYCGNTPTNLSVLQTDTYNVLYTDKVISIQNSYSYFKLVYTNTTSAQGTFYIQTYYSTISTNVVNNKLDTLHTDITSTNTKLDTLHNDLNLTIYTGIANTNTKLDTLHTDITSTNTKLDTVNTNITSTNTKLDTANTNLVNLIPSVVSTLNSTTTNLTSGSIFTGTAENVTKYRTITITIKSDKDSSSDGVLLYFGPSASSLSIKYYYTYFANENKVITINNTDLYFYIKYTNTSSAQTSFSLQTIYTCENKEVISKFESNAIDLFGNLKVSMPFTLIDISHPYAIDSYSGYPNIQKNNLLVDEYNTGTGTTVTVGSASVNMSVGANNDSVIRQSRIYAQYQPGKSICVRITGVLNANSNQSSTTSRIGYFDKNNGLFFEYSSGTYKVVVRKATSDTSTVQSSWNGEPNSHIDFTKNIIYYIEFAYLGVGLVKFGCIFAGKLYILHTLFNTTLTTPYIENPNLPIRWEINATSTTNNVGKIICTCGSVQSEGGYNLIGSPFSYTGNYSVSSGATVYFMSIRLISNMYKLVKLNSFTIYTTAATNGSYRIYKYLSPTSIPVTSGTPTYTSVNSNSVVEYHLNSSGTFTRSTTNELLVYQGYFSASSNTSNVDLTNLGGPLYLSPGIFRTAYTTDYYFLEVTNLDTGAARTVYATFNWIEI